MGLPSLFIARAFAVGNIFLTCSALPRASLNAPQAKTISLQAYKAPVKQIQATVKAAQPETQVFYQNAITEAVDANEMPKALSLLEEAKALGIKDAESFFINALEKNRK